MACTTTELEEAMRDKRRALEAETAPRPAFIQIEMPQSGAKARAALLWDKAPRTCAAVVASLPFSTACWHGRNSGAEALCLTPSVISDLPQDQTENATTEHSLDDLVFGYEPAGFCVGGAAAVDASEIAWFYGEACQACYWVSEDMKTGPFRLQAATLNVFGKIVEQQGFYATCANLPHSGDQQVTFSVLQE